MSEHSRQLLEVGASLYPEELLKQAKVRVESFAHQAVKLPLTRDPYAVKMDEIEAGRLILKSPSEELISILLVLSDSTTIGEIAGIPQQYFSWVRSLGEKLSSQLVRRKLPFDRMSVAKLLLNVLTKGPYWMVDLAIFFPVIERFHKEHGLDEVMTGALLEARGYFSDAHFTSKRIDKLLSDKTLFITGETWADSALQMLQALPPNEVAAWSSLIAHCKSATAGKPSVKWLQEAKPLVDEIGFDAFSAPLQSWLKLFASHHEAVNETNLDALKGLVWCASLQNDVALLRAVARAIPACVKNIERHQQYVYGEETHEYVDRTVRAPRLANACLWMLSQSDDVEAVAQLARLRLKVRHKGILNAIEKALAEAAKRLNVAPEELEELATPDFGLENGKLRRTWSGTHLIIDFASGKAVWNWTNEDGKALKAPPVRVKNEYSNELKELKILASEVEKTLVVVKERLDLMLRLERSWPYQTWRERYFDHALLGAVSRRVIWQWEQNERQTIGIWHSDGFVDFNSEKVTQPGEGATMRLWHPIHASQDEVAAWRRWLESSTRQPFKQAHREIYILTDAERTTRTYSNRFAAHIIRQHQFNSLCAARGWKNKLRLMVDDTYPPATKLLPQHNLRAEFWVEGIGDNYGSDTNETGTYLRLATDQVRFYRLDAEENWAQAGAGDYGARRWGATPAEPLPLEEIPPLVFSEVMRDVDLFVGVASVGNDPTWNDGGPEGRFINYWQDYSWGELNQTAQTRRDVLSRLLPRLKIADRCELLDKFLQVRGDLRTYKIHLGSGNILMEPNDQYLCIVPARGASPDGKVFLPFEGDNTMAIVLSKAFMLADDTKISDASIVSQIKRALHP